MIRHFVATGRARLVHKMRRMASIARGDGDPLEGGALIDVGPDARVIRDEAPAQFLWLDRPSYAARVRRALRRGQINAAEAALLNEWGAKGYAIIRGCIEPELIDAARSDIDRAWNERWHVSVDLLSGAGEHTSVDRCPPEARRGPYKLNQLHQRSEAIQRIFLHDRIIRLASLIFGAGVVGVNSLTFEFGSQQTTHVDHVYMTPSPPRRLLASWIALEDVRADAGPLEVWPGSHRLPPFRWSNPFPYHYIPAEQPDHERYMIEQRSRFTPELFMAKKGDVLLWHAMLAHGGKPIANPSQTRLSMACHYFSRECFGDDVAGLERYGDAWLRRVPMEDPD